MVGFEHFTHIRVKTLFYFEKNRIIIVSGVYGVVR